MANKLTVTRAEALEMAIEMLDRHCEEYLAMSEPDEISQRYGDAAESLRKMHASITKPREKTNEPSKTAKENIRLAAEVLKVMPAGEPVLTSWIMEHVNGIMTTQKCTKVMQVLISAGKVEKVAKVQGRYIGYKLA